MIQSNYERLAHCNRINLKRVQYLEDTIKALREYHTRARNNKKNLVMRMVIAYQIRLDNCYARMERISA